MHVDDMYAVGIARDGDVMSTCYGKRAGRASAQKTQNLAWLFCGSTVCAKVRQERVSREGIYVRDREASQSNVLMSP